MGRARSLATNDVVESTDILVIGAGLFGLTTAIEARRRGASVRVIEAGRLPHPHAASTDISKVVRMDYGADADYTELMERGLPAWREWNERANEVLYHEVGLLALAHEPLAPGGFEFESEKLLTARGHALQSLTESDLARDYPALAPGAFRAGYFNPNAGWAAARAVIQVLAREARAAGVRITEHAPVRTLVERGGRVVGAKCATGRTLEADVTVVAAGAWTPALLPELADRLRVTAQPVVHLRAPRGAALRSPALPVWTADIARTGWYGFPANDEDVLKVGHHGAGSAWDPTSGRDLPDGEELRFREMLQANFPALAGADLVEGRVCLYCDSVDGDFWIDHHAEREGLFVAAGGSGHAFKFAPLLGELAADALLDRRPHPRFRWRSTDTLRADVARSRD